MKELLSSFIVKKESETKGFVTYEYRVVRENNKLHIECRIDEKDEWLPAFITEWDSAREMYGSVEFFYMMLFSNKTILV